MQYITFDISGNTTGAYRQDLRIEHAANFLEATDAQYVNWANLIVVAGAFAPRPPPPPPTAQQLADAALASDANTEIGGDTLIATWKAKNWATFSADFDALTQANKLEVLKRSAFATLKRVV